MLRIGLIGAGWHASTHHAPALAWCAASEEFRTRIDLAAVCDLDLAKAQAVVTQYGFASACTSLAELVNRVDAVVAILPTDVMLPALGQITARNLPVLLEKPIGRNPNEMADIATVMHARPHMVSLNRRFDPGTQLARRWLQGRTIRQVHGLMSRVNRREPDFIWSTGIHLADLLCYLTDSPPRVTASTPSTDTWRTALLRSPDHVTGTLTYQPTAGRVDERVLLAGDDFSLDLRTGTHAPWRVRAYLNGRLDLDTSSPHETPEHTRNGTAAETATFLRAILDRTPMGPRIQDAIPGSQLAWTCAGHDS